MKSTHITLTAILLLGGSAFAQPPAPAAPPAASAPAAPPPAPAPPEAPGRLPRPGGPAFLRGQPPMTALRGPEGRWWGNRELAQKLAITDDQIKKMDDILQQHRLRLVDLHANLEKQELMLEPMVSADQPDEPKLLAQIDKVAQARAELEKANARMLLDIRRVLTADQWQKLKSEAPAATHPRPARLAPGVPGRAPR